MEILKLPHKKNWNKSNTEINIDENDLEVWSLGNEYNINITEN